MNTQDHNYSNTEKEYVSSFLYTSLSRINDSTSQGGAAENRNTSREAHSLHVSDISAYSVILFPECREKLDGLLSPEMLNSPLAVSLIYIEVTAAFHSVKKSFDIPHNSKFNLKIFQTRSSNDSNAAKLLTL